MGFPPLYVKCLSLLADELLLCPMLEDGAIYAVHLEPLNIISHGNGNNPVCVCVFFCVLLKQ